MLKTTQLSYCTDTRVAVAHHRTLPLPTLFLYVYFHNVVDNLDNIIIDVPSDTSDEVYLFTIAQRSHDHQTLMCAQRHFSAVGEISGNSGTGSSGIGASISGSSGNTSSGKLIGGWLVLLPLSLLQPNKLVTSNSVAILLKVFLLIIESNIQTFIIRQH
ncbi:hypothetical protein V8046_002134 [Vibrio parahaemolyticus]|nr:hypothetical protein [Vibrio parahaemolyticus]EIV8634118.1 hypothetical protein [Vibrio parahaemolyticus]EIZ1448000.1 hypothetical protein [Vibrio parahaemolyticus]EJF4457621.1 hypothetical protein [Vibrio parahaemolyticus]EKL0054217.1 hypothetical protein [Vibrio parahaemolyticus]